MSSLTCLAGLSGVLFRDRALEMVWTSSGVRARLYSAAALRLALLPAATPLQNVLVQQGWGDMPPPRQLGRQQTQ